MATSDASTSLAHVQTQPLFDVPCSLPAAGPAGLALSRSGCALAWRQAMRTLLLYGQG